MKKIKEDFIHSLTHIGLPETDAKKIINLFIDNIIHPLINKDEVHLVNFGNFKVVKKKKKSFINPKTKQVSYIIGENKAKFIPSKNLTKYINHGEL